MAIYECQVVFERPLDPGQDVVVNTLHVRTAASGPTQADARAAAEWVRDLWVGTGRMLSVMSNRLRLREVVTSEAGATGTPYDRLNVNVVGSVSVDMLPPQCACVISWRPIGQGGAPSLRRFWGRTYIPGLTEQDNENGRLTLARLNQISGIVNSWTLARPVGTFLVVYSRVHDIAETVDEWVIDDVWDIQRRRRFTTVINRVRGVIVG